MAKMAVAIDGDEIGVNSLTLDASDLAQSFRPTSDTSVRTVQLKLFRKGEAGGTLTLTLEGDSGNSPDGTALAKTTLPVSDVSNRVAEFYTFTFSKAAALTSGDVYWLRLKASYGASDDNLVQWGGNNTDPYSRGAAAYLASNGAWDTSLIGETRDYVFKAECTTQ